MQDYIEKCECYIHSLKHGEKKRSRGSNDYQEARR
jgi:hypothetical protein